MGMILHDLQIPGNRFYRCFGRDLDLSKNRRAFCQRADLTFCRFISSKSEEAAADKYFPWQLAVSGNHMGALRLSMPPCDI
jgi:hypothetical protein